MSGMTEVSPESALQAILNTIELVENILLHLDTRTLLLSQRVCQRWRSLVRTSQLIQQALFFKPSQPSGQDIRFNDLLSDVFAHEPRSRLVIHKLFQAGIESLRLLATAEDEDEHEGAFRPRGTSWRHMLVRQPPILAMGYITIEAPPRHNSEFCHAILPFPDGLRIGELYDLTLQVVNSSHGSRFGSRTHLFWSCPARGNGFPPRGSKSPMRRLNKTLWGATSPRSELPLEGVEVFLLNVFQAPEYSGLFFSTGALPPWAPDRRLACEEHTGRKFAVDLNVSSDQTLLGQSLISLSYGLDACLYFD